MELHSKEMENFEFERVDQRIEERGLVPQSDQQLDPGNLASDLLEDELRSDEPYMNPTSELHPLNMRPRDSLYESGDGYRGNHNEGMNQFYGGA